MRHPVDDRHVENAAAEEADGESGARAESPAREQQRHEADPAEKLEVDGRKRRRQHEPARDRESGAGRAAGVPRDCDRRSAVPTERDGGHGPTCAAP